jgi:hypothetical protein
LYQIFFFIALLIGIIPLLILFFYKKALEFNRAITPFIWLTALATIYEFAGTVLLKINTSYWFQVYSFLEVIILYYFFFRLFQTKYKIAFGVFLILLLITYGFSFFLWSENSGLITKAINKVPITFFVLTFSFLWFKELFYKMEIQNPWQNANFYFVTGFMLYYSSTFFLFLLASFLFKSNVYFYDYWLINIVATIILRTSLIIGVWKMKQD